MASMDVEESVLHSFWRLTTQTTNRLTATDMGSTLNLYESKNILGSIHTHA